MYEFHHYLPVDDTMMDWGIYLTGAGRGVIPSKDHYPPAGHPKLYAFDYHRGRILPEFQIVLITDGKGIFESKETGQVPITSGTVFMLFPNIWHRYKPDEKTGWKERWISLNGIFAHRLMDQGYMNPNNPIHQAPEPGHITSTFDHLLERIHDMPTENTLTTSLGTMNLLSQIIELFGSDAVFANIQSNGNIKSTQDALVKSTLDIIWTQSHRPISVDSILMQVPASRRTLERRFLKIHGHTIHEEIIQCRLSRSKRLLCETQLPVKTVAYLSGFGSSEKMRKAFVKKLGLSTSEFRKQNTVVNISDE